MPLHVTMNKKAVLLVVLAGAAWWFYRQYSTVDSYLLRVNNNDDDGVIQKVAYTFEGLNFGESIGMNISLAGLAYLKDWEGKVTKNGMHIVYLDSAGLPTIGYGHLIKKGENFSEIDEQTASMLLVNDLSDAEQLVNEALKIKVHQFMFDALVIFAYNWPKLKTSQTMKQINLKNWDAAFREWRQVVNVTLNGKKVKNQGLINRRENEIKLFKEGLNRL